MQRLTEEPRFDDDAQRQILSLAAEFQRYDQTGATLAELEAKAREAGIDPKYLRMAMGHVAPPVPQMAPATVRANTDRNWFQNNELSFLSVGAFGIVQVFSTAALMQRGPIVFPLAIILALVMGLSFSRTTAHRFGAVAAMVGSMIATIILTIFADGLGLTSNSLARGWGDDLFACLGLEFVALLLGFLIAAGARWVRKANQRPVP